MRPKFLSIFLVLVLFASFAIAYADSEDKGRAMLEEALSLEKQEKFLEAGQLCKKVVSEYPGTKAAYEADIYIEQWNEVALGDLREAYMSSMAFFTDKPDASVDLDTMRRYGFMQEKGTIIKIVKNTKHDLQITGEHLAGDKVYTIYADGRETTTCDTQEAQEAKQAFEKIVAKFKTFLSTNPKLLHQQTSPDSPTGVVLAYYKITPVEISYKTYSTERYISMMLIEYTNKNCGDVKQTSGGQSISVGYSTFDLAKENDVERCYSQDLPDMVNFNFVHKNNKWVFKDVVSTMFNKPAAMISTALGYPVAPSQYREENKDWEDLLK
jgi:hypothetical protein